MRLNLLHWILEKISCLFVFTPILFTVYSIAPQQVRFGGGCLGFDETDLIEQFGERSFLILLEISNCRPLRCVSTQFFVSVTCVCSWIKFLMSSISNKSFPVVSVGVFKDIEIFFKISLDDGFAKDFFMQLQVEFDVD